MRNPSLNSAAFILSLFFQGVIYCLSWQSLKAPLPGKNPVPPPVVPGLIPVAAGTYTPGTQDGGGDKSETATLNKNVSFPLERPRFSKQGPHL